MNYKQILLFIFFCIAACVSSAKTERLTWVLKSGESFKGNLIGFYDGFAYIDLGRDRTGYYRYNVLDSSSQELVHVWLQEYAESKANGPALVSESDSSLTEFLAENLVVWRDGELQEYDFAAQNEPEFYAFYYSAHWCGPCRRFTPKLRAFYKTMEIAGFDDFELIFVSSDTGPKMMKTYMEEEDMPWPAVKYGKRLRNIISKYKGTGIPCLVVTDRYGRLIYHSYRGDEYLGPDLPKNQLRALLAYVDQLEQKLKASREG